MNDSLHVVHVMLSLDVGGLEAHVLNQAKQAPRIGRVTVICLERPAAGRSGPGSGRHGYLPAQKAGD